jgi:hypothetical protein
MFTLADSSLLRFWCMNTGECVKSIILDKVDSIYETTGNPTEIFKQRPKIQFCELDPTEKYILVVF